MAFSLMQARPLSSDICEALKNTLFPSAAKPSNWQLMPHCMDVLMDDNNRVSYDAYAVAARAGAAPTSFDDFMNDVIKESPQARSGLLAIRDDSTTDASMTDASSTSALAAEASSAPDLSRDETRAASLMNTTSTVKENAKLRKLAHKVNYITVMGVFAGVFVLCDLVLALPASATLVVAPLSVLLSIWLQRRPNRNAVSSSASQQVSM